MTDTTTPPYVRTRLSVMMFLQYAIWGAWLPILYPFLLGHRGFELNEVGLILAGGAAGAIVGPFIAGQIADRFFASEKFLGVSLYAPPPALTHTIPSHHPPARARDSG